MAGSTVSKGGGEVRRLSDRELQDKRAKGLCFRCDAKWNIGHRCKRRELSVLLLDEEDDTESEGGNSEAPTSPVEELPAEVSLNSVIRLTNPKTMKLKGLIGHEEVVVLIDSGATYNFLSLGAIHKIGIVVTQSGPFGVSLGNGESIRGTGICKNVTLQLDGGLEVCEDFLPLELGSLDAILGVQWLEKLGTMMTNWKTQEMVFEMGGRRISLWAILH